MCAHVAEFWGCGSSEKCRRKEDLWRRPGPWSPGLLLPDGTKARSRCEGLDLDSTFASKPFEKLEFKTHKLLKKIKSVFDCSGRAEWNYRCLKQQRACVGSCTHLHPPAVNHQPTNMQSLAAEPWAERFVAWLLTAHFICTIESAHVHRCRKKGAWSSRQVYSSRPQDLLFFWQTP